MKTLDPASTPPEILSGQPQAFLQRLQPEERKNVILLSLAVLVETRRQHLNDPAVLSGLAFVESAMVDLFHGVQPTARRIIHLQNPPAV